jgi:pilus assembly protein Flp/PilA
MTGLLRFLQDEEGSSAIEYALIAGLVAVAIVVALTALGTDISGLFGTISTKLQAAGN